MTDVEHYRAITLLVVYRVYLLLQNAALRVYFDVLPGKDAMFATSNKIGVAMEVVGNATMSAQSCES